MQLSDAGLFLSAPEVQRLQNYLAEVDAPLLTLILDRNFGPTRQAMVQQVWDAIAGGQPTVTLRTIINQFNSAVHDKVRFGAKTADQLDREMIMAFHPRGPEDTVSAEEFMGVFRGISVGYTPDVDGDFEMMLTNCFSVAMANAAFEDMLVVKTEEAIRLKLLEKNTRSYGSEKGVLLKSFKSVDPFACGFVDEAGFAKALSLHGAFLTASELRLLYQRYASEDEAAGTTCVNYIEFVDQFWERTSGVEYFATSYEAGFKKSAMMDTKGAYGTNLVASLRG